MKKFTLKYYPPKILFIIVATIIALNFLIRVAIIKVTNHETPSVWVELGFIILSTAIIESALILINKHVMNKHFLKLLNLCDIRGTYEGEITSSFHENDDMAKPHIIKYCKITISQNINGVWLKGISSNGKYDDMPTSEFTSVWSDFEALEDDNYQLQYLYRNEGNQMHEEQIEYGLSNHKGYTCVTYDPNEGSFKGYYFTHERQGFGIIKFKKIVQ